jgi:hypothetical protein
LSTLSERTNETFFVVMNYPADSGAAETCNVDDHKMAARGDVCVVVVLGNTISYSSTQTLPAGIRRASACKRAHQAMVGTVSETEGRTQAVSRP